MGFDKKNMDAAIDASLKRLKTDYIDLYQLHWLERKVPRFGFLITNMILLTMIGLLFEEVLHNLDNLVKAGKVRFVGFLMKHHGA